MAALANNKIYSKIYHLGYQVIEPGLTFNSYLLKYGDVFVLFDLPPISKMEKVAMEIGKITPIEKITYLVIQNINISLINSINYLRNKGFKGTIVSNEFFTKQINESIVLLPKYIIEKHDYRLMLDEEVGLDFYPVFFLPHPQMFFTYFSQLATVLSSTLFSSFVDQDKTITFDLVKTQITAFEKASFPDKTFFKGPYQKISTLKVNNILPMFGYIIFEPLTNQVVDFIMHRDLIVANKETITDEASQLHLLQRENERMQIRQFDQEMEIAALKSQVLEAENAIYKDGVTKLLNQQYFKNLLIKDLAGTTLPGHHRGVLLFRLDQLDAINRKYSKEIGDETLRDLVYVIEKNIDDSNDLIFKQNGPGVFVYKLNTTPKKLREFAVKIRNAVDNSKAFIERVTVSVAIVSAEEVETFDSKEQQATEIMNLLDKRMRQAYKSGNAMIIDSEAKLDIENEGVVLLIDEDEISRNMLQRIFKRINLEVIFAKDVEDALQIIINTPIDFIISEINLSKMDGFALKRQLNETKEYRQIPFIMVSHSKTVENIRRGNLLDVDVILEKPIIPEELLGFIKRFRERKNPL
ncbi:MAG: response regulator [Bacilli bacterium]